MQFERVTIALSPSAAEQRLFALRSSILRPRFLSASPQLFSIDLLDFARALRILHERANYAVAWSCCSRDERRSSSWKMDTFFEGHGCGGDRRGCAWNFLFTLLFSISDCVGLIGSVMNRGDGVINQELVWLLELDLVTDVRWHYEIGHELCGMLQISRNFVVFCRLQLLGLRRSNFSTTAGLID